MNLSDVLIRPIITEKSMKDAKLGIFTFEVLKNAHKQVIKHAVERAFKVNAMSVRTSIIKGRSKRAGRRRTEIKQAPFKKAMVQLKEGQKIELFDVGEKKKK